MTNEVEGWLYLCEKCGEPCSERSSRKIEDGENEGERWCTDCLAANDPYADY